MITLGPHGRAWVAPTERFERQTTIELAGADVEPLGDGWVYDGASLHDGDWTFVGEHTPGRVRGEWGGREASPFVWQMVRWKRRLES